MQATKDSNSSSLLVHGHAVTGAASWRLAGNALVNVATEAELGLTPKLLHAFSIGEMRELERAYASSERDIAAKVLAL
jgi:hypothetical protein